MTSRPTRNYDLDPARRIDLADGWAAGVCLDEEGAESMWLVSPTPDAVPGCACRGCAPHEQHGAPPRPTSTVRRSGSAEVDQ